MCWDKGVQSWQMPLAAWMVMVGCQVHVSHLLQTRPLLSPPTTVLSFIVMLQDGPRVLCPGHKSWGTEVSSLLSLQ